MRLLYWFMWAVATAIILPQSATAQPLSPQSETPVSIGTSVRFRSAAMAQDRTVNIYLPAAYAAEPARRWPVLYVIDGGTAQDFQHIAGLANLGGLSGMYPDMIVVGVETVDRRNELTTAAANPRYRREFPTHGGAAAFRNMITAEIMPWVDATYRTNDQRIVIGESLAAYFIVETFLREPASFSHFVAISPSMWWDDMALAQAAPALLTHMSAAPRALYLTTANEGGDHLRGTERLAAAVRAANPSGLSFYYAPRPQEEHSTIYHGAALDALRWLFQERR